jgi:hypothetical protein
MNFLHKKEQKKFIGGQCGIKSLKGQKVYAIFSLLKKNDHFELEIPL